MIALFFHPPVHSFFPRSITNLHLRTFLSINHLKRKHVRSHPLWLEFRNEQHNSWFHWTQSMGKEVKRKLQYGLLHPHKSMPSHFCTQQVDFCNLFQCKNDFHKYSATHWPLVLQDQSHTGTWTGPMAQQPMRWGGDSGCKHMESELVCAKFF